MLKVLSCVRYVAGNAIECREVMFLFMVKFSTGVANLHMPLPSDLHVFKSVFFPFP